MITIELDINFLFYRLPNEEECLLDLTIPKVEIQIDLSPEEWMEMNDDDKNEEVHIALWELSRVHPGGRMEIVYVNRITISE